jgi:hypothetical protein
VTGRVTGLAAYPLGYVPVRRQVAAVRRREHHMTTTPGEPVNDEDIETVSSPSHGPADASGDADGADGQDAAGGDADGTDSVDGKDGGDADGTDGGDADGTDA